jgi:hypothetical protein
MALPSISLAPPEPVVRTLKGKVVGSENEYNYGKGLERACWTYYFQYYHWFGTPFPGDIRPDFIVWSRPFYTPVFVDGLYWHSGSDAQDDILFRLQLDSEFATIFSPHISVSEEDTDSLELGYHSALEHFGSNC